jgi:putative ABC transport system substrate-binding protein
VKETFNMEHPATIKQKYAVRKLFLVCLGFFVLTSMKSAEAQQRKNAPRMGLLALLAAPSPLEEAFLQGLRDLGYHEGRNLNIEYRWAAGKTERLSAFAEELVRLKVDLIAARATPAVAAAKNATGTSPIVMLGADDAIGSGFISSLAHPGGNITGTTNIMPELSGKRLELLREILPNLSRVAFLAYGSDPAHKLFVRQAEDAARDFRIRFQPVVIGSPAEIDGAFAAIAKERVGAVIVQPLFITSFGLGKKIADLAARNRVPTVSDGTSFAESGGLMFYGPDQAPLFRQAATYVDKILKGAKPGDLPVAQPTKFELIINLKAAKQIGLAVPPHVLARADKVIR